MTPHELAKLLEADKNPILELVRTHRPYKTPKGFMDWRALSAIVALCLDMYSDQSQDLASRLNASRTALWFVQDAPMYCLNKELLRAFEQSDVEQNSGLLADLRPPLPTFILLFPQNSIKTPEFGVLDFCVVHLSDVEHPEYSIGEAFGIEVPYLKHEHDRNLHWSGVDTKEVVWFSGCGLKDDGRVIHSRRDLGEEKTTDQDHDFLSKIRSVILQCILTLTYAPELLEKEPVKVGTTRKYGMRLDHEPTWRYPRWLGKEYSTHSSSNGGTHASPRSHWRAGHWRRVVVGSRELQERKWVWIQPVLVNRD